MKCFLINPDSLRSTKLDQVVQDRISYIFLYSPFYCDNISFFCSSILLKIFPLDFYPVFTTNCTADSRCSWKLVKNTEYQGNPNSNLHKKILTFRICMHMKTWEHNQGTFAFIFPSFIILVHSVLLGRIPEAGKFTKNRHVFFTVSQAVTSEVLNLGRALLLRGTGRKVGEKKKACLTEEGMGKPHLFIRNQVPE